MVCLSLKYRICIYLLGDAEVAAAPLATVGACADDCVNTCSERLEPRFDYMHRLFALTGSRDSRALRRL